MNAVEIIKKCHRQGVELTLNGDDRLDVYGPKEAVTDELKNAIRAVKPELISILLIKDVDQCLDQYDKSYVLCDYNGISRDVHPAVCEWHLELNDKKCAGCDWGSRIIPGNRALH